MQVKTIRENRWKAREKFLEYKRAVAARHDDAKGIVAGIVTRAKDGDRVALKYFFDWILGGKVQTAVQNNYIFEGQPGAPTDHPPGSEGKLDAMARRRANGQPCFAPGDGQRDLS